ncbi:PREDICTED: uncharacterized protein LOC105558138 [Vollenhovia emeryi]|uniref:uncharacterized protein LOC105558138 n=1 Tax=Vollenhovia emeryi TaxID=411798 RepID=UPI0005F4771A|nr:PREDICTED: uncharacterized protein LOC105558138 [Vollenhovia emeryi]
MDATKCGYCGFILRGSCETLLDHDCFKKYNETEDVINVDSNAVVTMSTYSTSEQSIESFRDHLSCLFIYVKVKRHQTESVVQHEGASQSATQSVLTQNELLIELVRTRRALWDHSIPITERTRLKKESLWQEIRYFIIIINMMFGSMILYLILYCHF